MGMYASMLFQRQVVNASLISRQPNMSFHTQAVWARSKPTQKHVMFF